MSIASQIEDYADGLSAAYDIVQQRGGTIPAQKNMNNLDTAIATIPSGGGSPTTPTITNATYSNGVITITGTDFGSSPTIKMYNRKYSRYDDITPTASTSTSATISVGTSDHGYYSRLVKVENGGFESNPKFVYADFENLGVGGYDVILWCYGPNNSKVPLVAYGTALANTFNVSISSSISVNPITQRRPGTIPVTKISDSTSANMFTAEIIGIEINTSITSIISTNNSAFLGYCYSLIQPIGLANVTTLVGADGTESGGFIPYATAFNDYLDISNVTSLGRHFMVGCCSFDQPLDLSNLTMFNSRGFMAYCYNFNKPIIFPTGGNNVTASLPSHFMRDCYSFSQPLVFDGFDISDGGYILYNSWNLPSITFKNITVSSSAATSIVNDRYSSSVPAYLDGITINGDSTASQILTLYPDMASSSGYRKLIQGTITS